MNPRVAESTGGETRLLIDVGPPYRLDFVAWALRRRAHNEVDRFDDGCYRRVVTLDGQPVETAVRSELHGSAVVLAVHLRGGTSPLAPAAIKQARILLTRILGLEVDLGGFYRLAATDERLGVLARRFRGMRPPCFPSAFEAVVNAVACQQLSLDVGILLLNRLARRFGPMLRAPAPVYGFPQPEQLAAASPTELRALGFSSAKARTIIAIATRVADKTLDLERLRGAGDEEALGILTALPGIGRWSAQYVLLRGLSRHHVLPGDDVGARNNLRRRFNLAAGAGYDEVAQLSRAWHPYAGLVYFHLLLDSLAERGYLKEAR